MNIILCGYKNCGKTTIGKLFAQQYCCDFIDVDDLIHQRHPELKDVFSVYTTLGEAVFRETESAVIHSLKDVSNTVIATGGGAVCLEKNLKLLKKQGKIVYLKIAPKELLIRMKQSARLPAFIDEQSPEKSFWEHYENRDKIYQQASDYQIELRDKKKPEILEALNQIRQQHGE